MLNNINIAKRLLLLIGGLLAWLAVIGFMGLRGVSGTSDGLRSVYENNTVPLVRLGELLDVVYQSRAQVITGMQVDSSSAAEVHFKEVAKANQTMSQGWAEYQAALASSEAKVQAGQFDQAWQAYVESGDKTMALARSGDYEAASDFMKQESAKKFDAAREALLQLMRFEKDNAKAAFEKSNQENAVLNTVVLVTLAGGLGVGGWLSFAVTRSIIGPLNLMRSTICEVEETYDFSKRVPLESADEVGQTARSFNELMSILQTSFGDILGNVTQVSDAAHRLSAVAGQVASGSEQESSDAAAMASTIEEVTVSVSHISDSARQALKVANKSGELSVEGGEIIHGAATQMTQIADTVRRTSQTIEELGQQSQQISSIVQVIKDVADQTNLLALNAAIEAARAGEQGRGFAVVADEVRKLAERTTNATGEITRMIDAMQSSANAAVNAMSSTVSQVDGGVTLANRAGEAINQIRDGGKEVIAVINEISAALVEQSSASESIASHVERVAQNTERNSSAASESATSAQHMDALAASMRETVGRFRI